MGYFEEYDLDSRFKSTFQGWNPMSGHYHVVIDWDQRRTIVVCTPGEKDEEFVFEALEELIDGLAPDVVTITVTEDLELASASSDLVYDRTMLPFYPLHTSFPPDVPTIRRAQLTEIERLGLQADHATYTAAPGEAAKDVVFKYYTNEGNIAMFWHEVNCMLRIPRHPHIVPLDRLVLESTAPGQPDKVVGFTTPFIPGGTILDNPGRPFKLKHLRQLLSTIDYLNLTLHLNHGDICLWNLLIDPLTDSLLLFDFNMGFRNNFPGDAAHNDVFGEDLARADVKLAVFTVYELITRDHSFRNENEPEDMDAEAMVWSQGEWVKDEEVALEEGVEVAEYRRVLEEWVKGREGREDAGRPEGALEWPDVPEFPAVEFVGGVSRSPGQMRQALVRRGEPFIKWQRPPTCALPLPDGQRLLATGEVVTDGVEEK